MPSTCFSVDDEDYAVEDDDNDHKKPSTCFAHDDEYCADIPDDDYDDDDDNAF